MIKPDKHILNRGRKAPTFLELSVLVAEGMGFWVAMDWMRRGEEEAKLPPFAAAAAALKVKGTPPALLHNAVASIFLPCSLR